FFFQAEDGIRDDLVTGVQTCALPISRHAVNPFCCAMMPKAGSVCPVMRMTGTFGYDFANRSLTSNPEMPGIERSSNTQTEGSRRSEERRVGKEWRAEWRR